jgi:competence protein ComEA
VRASAVILVCCLSTSTTSSPARAAGKAVDGAVNLNTAPPEVLALLPGIGPAKAQSIVVYRKKHPFRTVDELVRIKGVGHKMVRRLRAHLAVGGPTTATPVVGGAALAPVPPPPPPKRPVPLACVRSTAPPARSARPAPPPFPSHGACPRPP